MSGPAKPRHEETEIIDAMQASGFLSRKQADVLHTAHNADPLNSRWFVSTIAHHAMTAKDGENLSDDNFIRLCLMSIHRYKTQDGALPVASENGKIKGLFNKFHSLGVPESRNDGHGALLALRNHLTRTVEDVGVNIVREIEQQLKSSGHDWAALNSNADIYFKARSKAELSYIERLENKDGEAVLAPVVKQMALGRPLTQLLKSDL